MLSHTQVASQRSADRSAAQPMTSMAQTHQAPPGPGPQKNEWWRSASGACHLWMQQAQGCSCLGRSDDDEALGFKLGRPFVPVWCVSDGCHSHQLKVGGWIQGQSRELKLGFRIPSLTPWCDAANDLAFEQPRQLNQPRHSLSAPLDLFASPPVSALANVTPIKCALCCR